MANVARYTYIFVVQARNEEKEPFEFKFSGEGNKEWLTQDGLAHVVERYAEDAPSGHHIEHIQVLKRIDNWTGRVHEVSQ